VVTGKSVSEALILESVKPQYDERLFIEFQEKYKLTTCCVQKLFFCFCFDIQNNICTQHVVNLYFSWNSMNNLSSYCGLTDARMRASEKDLPVKLGFGPFTVFLILLHPSKEQRSKMALGEVGVSLP
jgi:hypothetical protein